MTNPLFITRSDNGYAKLSNGTKIHFEVDEVVGEYTYLESTDLDEIKNDQYSHARPEYSPFLCSGTGRLKEIDPSAWTFEGEPPLAQGYLKFRGNYYRASLDSTGNLKIKSLKDDETFAEMQ